MSDNERYEGTPVVVGDKTYIVPPLGLGKMRKYLPFIKQISAGEMDFSEEKHFDMPADIIYSSLVRNYPEMTREYMEDEVLNIGNLKTFIEAVCKTSGLVRGGKTSGKAEAESPLTLMN